jgi:branched-subunit amino acid ABC-type transport system permease component
MDILFGSLAAGILLGMVIALVALGLTIIFGVMDIVNFAHGEFLMIGMYTGLLAAQAPGFDPLFTLPLAAAVGFVLGILCYAGFVRFLLRGPMVAQLLGTFGLMLFLRNLAHQSDGGSGQHDDEGGPRAVQNPTENVSPKLVRPKWVVQSRRRKSDGKVLLIRIIGGHPRGEDGHEKQR